MLVNIGTLYDRLGLGDQAIHYFQRALQLKPDFATAYNNLAATYIGLARFDEARSLLEQCLRLNSNYAEAWNNLGSIEQSQGFFSASTIYFQEALKRSPGYFDAQTNLATAQRSIGDLPAAEASFARAMELRDSDALRIKAAFLLPPILESQAQIAPLRERLQQNLERLAAQTLRVTDPIKDLGHDHFYLAYHGLNDRDFNCQIADIRAQGLSRPDLHGATLPGSLPARPSTAHPHRHCLVAFLSTFRGPLDAWLRRAPVAYRFSM